MIPRFGGKVKLGDVAQIGDDLRHARRLGTALDDFANGMDQVGREPEFAGQIGNGVDGVGLGFVDADDGHEMARIRRPLVEKIGPDEARLNLGIFADAFHHFPQRLGIASLGFTAEKSGHHRGGDSQAKRHDFGVDVDATGSLVLDDGVEIFPEIAWFGMFHFSDGYWREYHKMQFLK